MRQGWDVLNDGLYIAEDMFVGEAQARVRAHLSVETLKTAVYFSDALADDTLGTVLDFDSQFSPSGKVILLNSRVLVDPEQLAHTALEEMLHVERALRGRDFDLTLPYKDQVHEQSARRGTLFFVGFARPKRYGRILRDHLSMPGTAGKLTVPQSRLQNYDFSDLSNYATLHPVARPGEN